MAEINTENHRQISELKINVSDFKRVDIFDI